MSGDDRQEKEFMEFPRTVESGGIIAKDMMCESCRWPDENTVQFWDMLGLITGFILQSLCRIQSFDFA